MKDKKHYTGHRERLRGRLERDPRHLADYEILELLLGHVIVRQDTKPLAKALLERFGTIRGVFAARPEELRQVRGFGPKLETFWALWRETWARLNESPLAEREVFSSPQAVAQMAKARLGHKTTEEFWLALLDKKNRLVGWEQVTRGTVDELKVYVRELMKSAITNDAASIILVHNHPGGDPAPSKGDRLFTMEVLRGAETMGVAVLDHIVVTADDHFSFKSEGLLG